MQPPWTHDRRRALRVDVPRRAWLGATQPDTGLQVHLREISTGGMLVEGFDALEPDSGYAVCLAVAGHATLTLEGRVVHSRATMRMAPDARVRYRSAVEFAVPAPDRAAALAAIVASVQEALETEEHQA